MVKCIAVNNLHGSHCHCKRVCTAVPKRSFTGLIACLECLSSSRVARSNATSLFSLAKKKTKLRNDYTTSRSLFCTGFLTCNSTSLVSLEKEVSRLVQAPSTSYHVWGPSVRLTVLVLKVMTKNIKNQLHLSGPLCVRKLHRETSWP